MKWNPGITNDGENTLVQAAIKGDTQAFHQIYNLYAECLYSYIFFCVSNQLEAEELTSQLFVDAWKRLSEYDNEVQPILGWLYTLALKQVISHLSSRKPDSPSSLKSTEAASDSSEPSVRSNPNPGEPREVGSLKIQQKILKLPFEHQLVIYLRHVENFKTTRICNLTGKSEMAIINILLQSYQLLWDY